MIRRLVSVGSVVVDVVATVGALPPRGGDVLASAGSVTIGGGFNLLAAASRQGLSSVYAGTTGSGPFGDLARAALAADGVATLHAPVPGCDTGFVVALVDADGERTFVTVVGAEGRLTADLLDGFRPTPTDAVCVSGYGLLHPANRDAILGLLGRLPAATTVLLDPGPLGHTVPAAVLDAVRARTDWWSGNAREATLATGLDDPADAAAAIAATTRTGAIVRTGPDGCVLALAGAAAQEVPGFAVEVRDTNGAGDAHVGAFLAALADGCTPADAARRANAVAALTVTRPGPAASPGRAEVLDRFGPLG